MRVRWIAALAVVCVLFCFTACRIRVDLTQNMGEETDTTTTTTIAKDDDEMTKAAWQMYDRALTLESEYTTYEQEYEGRQTVMGETMVTKARFVRVQEGEEVSLLIESDYGGELTSGYFKDGVGYFSMDGKKYWMPTDEKTFYEEMGFTETEPLIEEMFAQAIVMRHTDGSSTVTCPLIGKYATGYALMYLGDFATGSTVKQAESGVTVDADGHPKSFTAAVTVQHRQYGSVSMESESRYVAVGEGVKLTPPSDLASYSSIVE